MGPFELVDLVGLDTRLSILEYLHKTMGEKYRPCPLLSQYVKAGRLGKKVGKVSTNTDISRHGRVAVVQVNRPGTQRARPCHRAGTHRGDRHAVGYDGVGAIVMTGAGDAVFVSGADINDIRARTRNDELAAINSTLFAAIEVPEGDNRGCQWAGPGWRLRTRAFLRSSSRGRSCQVRAAGSRAGRRIPGAGATQRLPRIVGLDAPST